LIIKHITVSVIAIWKFLRTVVAYQNPFTGDYCVRKSRSPKGYVNQLQVPDSPDSGLSDEYEPLQLDPQVPQASIPEGVFGEPFMTADKVIIISINLFVME
jgi:hypothetical protein